MAVKSDVVTVRRVPRISPEEYREKLGLRRLDIFGRELPDGTRVEPPVDFVKTPSIFETHREMIRKELDARAAAQGFETSEEAEDFNIGEDEPPMSRYQYTEMEEEQITKFVEYYNGEIVKAKAAKAAKHTPKDHSPEAKGAGAGGVSPKGDPAAPDQDAE